MNNNLDNNSSQTKYRASKNLNTAIEDPSFNVKDTLDVNIENGINNYAKEGNGGEFSSNFTSVVDSSFNNLEQKNNGSNNYIDEREGSSPIDITSVNDNNNFNIKNKNDKVSYAPTVKEKKKKVSFEIPTELKTLIIIVLFLLVFVFLMPNIYDIVKEIKLNIFGR